MGNVASGRESRNESEWQRDYRAGNHGRGRGKGPIERMVIRTVERRIVFEDTPSGILVDIDLNLKL